MSNPREQRTQHEELVLAGWRYDKASDMYEAPGTPQDGSARRLNIHAAWLEHLTRRAPSTKDSAAHRADALGKATIPIPDPRMQEPE